MTGPFGHAFRLALLTDTAMKDKQQVGTYGMVKNRQPWCVVVSPDHSRVHFYVEFFLKGEVGVGPRKYACPPEYLDIGCHYRSFEVAMISEGVAGGSLEIRDPGIQTPASGDYEYIVS